MLCPVPTEPPSYRGHRYPAEIISHAVWLYYRFSLSLRDVEELLAEGGSHGCSSWDLPSPRLASCSGFSTGSSRSTRKRS